jgi:archaellum component FlaD/FlaE
MPAQAPVIKEDPIELDVPDNPELDDEEREEKKKSPKGKKRKKPVEDDFEDEEEVEEDREERKYPGEEELAKPRAPQPGFSKRDLDMINEFEEQKKMLEAMKSKTSEAGPATLSGSKRIDPYTMNQIMDRTRMMLRKNGSERMKDLLEMYVSTGYISDETKAIVQRMSKLMESELTRPPKRLDIKATRCTSS